MCDDLILTIMILMQVMVIKTAIRMTETDFTIVDHILDKTREKFLKCSKTHAPVRSVWRTSRTSTTPHATTAASENGFESKGRKSRDEAREVDEHVQEIGAPKAAQRTDSEEGKQDIVLKKVNCRDEPQMLNDFKRSNDQDTA